LLKFVFHETTCSVQSSTCPGKPAKLREQPDGGLLDKLVFGVGVGHEN
jgi:hypothetical protein